MFRAVHHTGLVVSDLDRSIDFYHDTLGLAFYNEPTPWFSGPRLALGVGVPSAELRQVTFWVGETSTVELEYRNPRQTATRPEPNNRLGAAHVCLRVDDVRAAKAELEAKGVVFYGYIKVGDEGPMAGGRWVYFSDPDGLALELFEITCYPRKERLAAIADYPAARG